MIERGLASRLPKKSLKKGLIEKVQGRRSNEEGPWEKVRWRRSTGEGLMEKVRWKKSDREGTLEKVRQRRFDKEGPPDVGKVGCRKTRPIEKRESGRKSGSDII